MKNATSPKIAIGFIVTLILSIANAGIAYHSINKITINNYAEVQTNRRLDVLEDMLSTLKNVELGQREYLLTNYPQYLEAHRIDITEIRLRLKELGQLQLDLKEIVPFDRDIERHLTELNQTIDLRQIQPLSSERQFSISKRAQQLIDEIRQLTTDLAHTERFALDRLQTESKKSLNDANISFIISGLIDLLFLVVLYVLVNTDLTKRRSVESQLQDYVAEFAELYHNAPCGYHSIDANGQIMRINRTELQMLGYEETEIVGQKNFAQLLTPDSAKIFSNSFNVIKKRGWIRDLELQLLHKDGRIVPASVTAIAVYDDAGNYLMSRSTVIDISDRVRSRQQFKLSAEISQKIRQSLQLDEILQTAVREVQQLLDVDRVLIYRFEADGTGTVVQEKVMVGFPVVMGNTILDPCFVGAAAQNEHGSYYDRDRQGRISNIPDITQAGFQPCYVEFLQQFAVKAMAILPIYLREDLWGLLIVHHCQSPRTWQSREVEILAQLATQIGIALSQSQLLEQEQLQRQELARSNAELEQFAHIASHDLQEPLRMVISYLQLLERRYQGKLDADADEFIDYAVDGAVRMQALIQGLLSYARVSSRAQPFEPVDCNLILQDALANLHVAITESAAMITSDRLPVVWGDPTQLTQLFQNLIANAIKFRRETPLKIQISSQPIAVADGKPFDLDPLVLPQIDFRSSRSLDPGERGAGAWCFAVADNGIGIETQYLDRIFAIFQRLHTRASYPGTGIGLAICKKIVERHGGKIWAKSTIAASVSSEDEERQSVSNNDRGSVFYFIIPEVGSNPTEHAHKQPQH